ncbi:hypothetical protein CY35_07G103200 [Sphagnum magellanicum]|uniref:Uncharacterized protein n=1 Tax=Sphagnum magellanicum TaxID=128215 RepID=A0ACB8HNH4_9BRYO|nr:hypothetical protein CY35_07G103200 [Sphagnum magellanicum]
MTWRGLSKVVDPCNNHKSVSGGQGHEVHQSFCGMMALNNCQYVYLADNEGDGGSSNYKPPKRTQFLKSFGDGKGSPWNPPPPPRGAMCTGNTKNILGWGVDGGGDGDGGGSKIKPGKCDIW